MPQHVLLGEFSWLEIQLAVAEEAPFPICPCYYLAQPQAEKSHASDGGREKDGFLKQKY